MTITSGFKVKFNECDIFPQEWEIKGVFWFKDANAYNEFVTKLHEAFDIVNGPYIEILPIDKKDNVTITI